MTNQTGAPLAAFATLLLEVMDKEPPLAQRAAVYGVLSFVGVLLARKRWWLGLLVLPVVALLVLRMSANYVILLSAQRSLKRRACCTL